MKSSHHDCLIPENKSENQYWTRLFCPISDQLCNWIFHFHSSSYFKENFLICLLLLTVVFELSSCAISIRHHLISEIVEYSSLSSVLCPIRCFIASLEERSNISTSLRPRPYWTIERLMPVNMGSCRSRHISWISSCIVIIFIVWVNRFSSDSWIFHSNTKSCFMFKQMIIRSEDHATLITFVFQIRDSRHFCSVINQWIRPMQVGRWCWSIE